MSQSAPLPWQRLQANGLEFAYLDAGPRDGQLVVCLHGFPDTAHTWGELVPALASAGYRVVCPNMRGYAPTAIPADASYGALELGRDVLGLIGALGHERAFVIGHDWGALAAYAATQQSPETVTKLTVLAIPHPGSLRPTLRGVWKARHFISFQRKRAARRWLREGDWAGVEAIYRRWSPNWDVPASELDEVRAAFSAPGGLDAALGYYWSFRAELGDRQAQATMAKVIERPTLAIFGEADGALEMRAVAATRAYFSGPYELHTLPTAGHFVHRERPEQVAELILAFLRD